MNPLRLLVVDDEPDLEALMRQKFRRQVRDREVELHFARDGEEALAVLRQHPEIEVVLTDINMPRMDGLSLLARMKEEQVEAGAIIVSAYGDMGNIRTAMNRGAFDFLMKPIDFGDLEQTVRRGVSHVRDLRAAQAAHLQLQSIRRELEVAANIQRAILPASFPAGREVRFAAMMEPAREVGGDFYDAYPLDSGRVAFVIGDVSGKGVPAALYMAVSRTLIAAVALTQGTAARTLEISNTMLCAQEMQEMFATVIFGVLDTGTGRVELCSAGHEAPYLIPATGGSPRRLPLPRNIALGVDISIAEFHSCELQLNAGDTLLLHTDGVTEAQSASGELYGPGRLEAVLHSATGDLVRDIAGSVRLFSAGTPQADDITILALTFLGCATSAEVFEARCPYRVASLADTLALFEAWSAAQGVPRQRFLHCLLCAEEALANIILHGTPAGPGDLIRVEARHAQGRIRLVLEDGGAPYNPLEHPVPVGAPQPDNARRPGGLGILLIRRHAEQMEYRRENDRNVLTIVCNTNPAEHR